VPGPWLLPSLRVSTARSRGRGREPGGGRPRVRGYRGSRRLSPSGLGVAAYVGAGLGLPAAGSGCGTAETRAGPSGLG
jgi:hypothetical protein